MYHTWYHTCVHVRVSGTWHKTFSTHQLEGVARVVLDVGADDLADHGVLTHQHRGGAAERETDLGHLAGPHIVSLREQERGSKSTDTQNEHVGKKNTLLPRIIPSVRVAEAAVEHTSYTKRGRVKNGGATAMCSEGGASRTEVLL